MSEPRPETWVVFDPAGDPIDARRSHDEVTDRVTHSLHCDWEEISGEGGYTCVRMVPAEDLERVEATLKDALAECGFLMDRWKLWQASAEKAEAALADARRVALEEAAQVAREHNCTDWAGGGCPDHIYSEICALAAQGAKP